MIYIIWALLNIAILVGISILLYKLIKPRLGGFSAGFAVFLFIGLTGYSNKDDSEIMPNSNRIKTWQYVSSDNLDHQLSTHSKTTLDENIFHSYHLDIHWGILKNSKKVIPINANSWTTGLSIATKWNPINIIVNETSGVESYKYQVIGSIKWTLLGITIYSQPKNWVGIVTFK